MPATNKNNDGHTEAFWQRVDAVITLCLENDRYLQSKRLPELTKTVMERFEVEDRMAQYYIREAKAAIRKLGKKDVDKAFKRAIQDREFLYRKAITALKTDKGDTVGYVDLELALKVAKDRDELQGLYTKNVKVEGEVKNKIDFTGITTESIKELIRELTGD